MLCRGLAFSHHRCLGCGVYPSLVKAHPTRKDPICPEPNPQDYELLFFFQKSLLFTFLRSLLIEILYNVMTTNPAGTQQQVRFVTEVTWFYVPIL